LAVNKALKNASYLNIRNVATYCRNERTAGKYLFSSGIIAMRTGTVSYETKAQE